MREFEVARFSTLPEAELATALLQRHGIAARLPDRDMATMLPHLHIAIGGVRVVAPEDRITEARDIVERARAGAFAAEVDQDTDDWRLDGTPGKVGDLDEGEISGVLGPVKKLGAAALAIMATFYLLVSCPA
ncbi:MAG: putative signal transducing protein [Brevundimonas sp.]